MTQQIHIIEDDVAFGKMLTSFLVRKGFDVTVSLNGQTARKTINEQTFDLLITDLQLQDDSGLELLEYTKEKSPGTNVILMTAYSEVDTAVKAIKKGALDYISKPFRPEELLMIIEADSMELNSKSKSKLENDDLDSDVFQNKNNPESKPN